VRLGPRNALAGSIGATVDSGIAAKPPSATEWRGTVHLVVGDGTPGSPPRHDAMDVQLTLLPGATTTDPLGWTQPVSWVAAYSSSWYEDRSCPTSPTSVAERTVVRGTGERPGTNANDYPRIGIRWDAQRSKWVIALSFFGGTMLADGAATSTALRGEGRPSAVANGLWGPSDRMVVTWNRALGRTK
jgi:hypothetical protein